LEKLLERFSPVEDKAPNLEARLTKLEDINRMNNFPSSLKSLVD